MVRYNFSNMNPRLLNTKFFIPPWRTSDVPRPRLIEQINAGLQERRRLTLVSAPAGYGKTTIVAEWINSFKDSSVRVCWLSVDSADNDPGRFLNYLLAALQRADAIAEKQWRFFDFPQLPTSILFVDALLNDLSERNATVILVLDDYHVISNPVIHEALEYFLDHQPPCVHLVLTTRQDPPLPLARLRARRQMTEIRARDLRFTPDEARHFFIETMKINISEEAVNALDERAEGWAVGLQLVGLALQGTADAEQFIQTFSGSHRYILDYLAEEVISRQSEDVRTFLSQTSILDQFNVDLCCDLTGRLDAQQIIDYLEKANLFIVPLDDERVWYRYHHLFRDYLAILLDKFEQAALNKKASAWHEARELLPEAVHYALTSGDHDFSAGVIDRVVNRNTTWSSGNISLLCAWLDALPTEVLQARPQLSLHASRIFYLASQFKLAEKHLAQVEESLKALPESQERTHLQALATLYRGSIACVHGEIEQALEKTTFARSKLPENDHLAHARAFFNLGQIYESTGRTDQAVKNYLQSSDAAQAAGVKFLAIQARCSAAQVQMQQGRLSLAEQTCGKAIYLAADNRIPPLGLAYIVTGGIALERNDLQAAEHLIKDGIALSRQGGLLDNEVFGLSMIARLRAYLGDAEGALAAVHDARAIIQAFEVPLLAAHAEASFARINLYLGQKQAAGQWAAAYRDNRPVSAQEYEELTLAHVGLASGQTDALPSILQPLLEKARRAGRMQTCMETMVILALFHHTRQETRGALNWLEKALKLAAPEGYVRVFLDVNAVTGGYLLDLLSGVRPAAPEFVDALRKAIEPEDNLRIAANVRLPEPLSDQELRVLDYLLAGKTNQEISEALVITVGTAKWHVHNILQKLGVNNRSQAIARARELGLD